MTSNADLEKSIRRYSDTFGTVLLGMHQDLQNQQQTVDRKLSAWHKNAERYVAEFATASSDIQSSARMIEEQISKQTALLHDVEAASAKQFQSIRDALTTATTNLAKLTQVHRMELESQTQSINEALVEIKAETDKRLRSLEQSQLAHQRQMTDFARRTRALLLAAVAVATLLVIIGVLLK